MSNFSNIYRGRVISIRRRKFFGNRRRTRVCRRILIASLLWLAVSIALRNWVAVAGSSVAIVASALGAIR
jgi:hypothetical protein